LLLSVIYQETAKFLKDYTRALAGLLAIWRLLFKVMERVYGVVLMKVTYTDKSGKKVELTFGTEDEGKKLKEKLKAQGVKDAKWEW
jgi:hypothetical protein